ncbi:hypothetical protein JSY36_16560, partial [Bacillus sp. H-16]|uniref:hypothetical protein n=1 Tax=Alteribacter salitolerans TaxID=2912333 RepID=UPI00196258D2
FVISIMMHQKVLLLVYWVRNLHHNGGPFFVQEATSPTNRNAPVAVTSIYISNELRFASKQIAAKRNRKREKHGDFSRLVGTATER